MWLPTVIINQAKIDQSFVPEILDSVEVLEEYQIVERSKESR